MDFKSYANGQNGGSGHEKRSGGGGNSFDGDLNALLSGLAAEYDGASENEIISAIIAEAEKGRRNGTLSDADLDAFAASVEPALDRRQRAKLKKVVEYLKRL